MLLVGRHLVQVVPRALFPLVLLQEDPLGPHAATDEGHFLVLGTGSGTRAGRECRRVAQKVGAERERESGFSGLLWCELGTSRSPKYPPALTAVTKAQGPGFPTSAVSCLLVWSLPRVVVYGHRVECPSLSPCGRGIVLGLHCGDGGGGGAQVLDNGEGGRLADPADPTSPKEVYMFNQLQS